MTKWVLPVWLHHLPDHWRHSYMSTTAVRPGHTMSIKGPEESEGCWFCLPNSLDFYMELKEAIETSWINELCEKCTDTHKLRYECEKPGHSTTGLLKGQCFHCDVIV